MKQYPFRKIRRPSSETDYETWGGGEIANTLNLFDISDVRSTNIVVGENMGFIANYRADGLIGGAVNKSFQVVGNHDGHISDYTNLIEERRDEVKTIVRRLTPRECERLQGFPDDWTLLPEKKDMDDSEVDFWNAVLKEKATIDGKKYKDQGKKKLLKWYNKMVKADSHRYAALGNSICIPQHYWYMNKIKALGYLDDGATLGSLFDGIGGFPIAWEETYGKGTCLWASEVEPFPIAVTKERFNEKTVC